MKKKLIKKLKKALKDHDNQLRDIWHFLEPLDDNDTIQRKIPVLYNNVEAIRKRLSEHDHSIDKLNTSKATGVGSHADHITALHNNVGDARKRLDKHSEAIELHSLVIERLLKDVRGEDSEYKDIMKNRKREVQEMVDEEEGQ